MKKILFMIVVLLVVVLCWDSPEAFQDATKPFNFVARDTIKATKLNANWDTLYTRANDLYDSLDIKFLRFTDFRDSTIDSIKTNRIISNPSIDSIQGLNVLRGNPDIDSISGLNVLRGNPDIDSISGATKFTGVKTFVDAVTFSSTANVDSLFSTKGIKASKFTGAVTGNLTGNVTGNLTGNIFAGQGSNHFDTLGTGESNNTITVTGFAVYVVPQAGRVRDTLRYISGSGDFLTVINANDGDTIFVTAHTSLEDTLFKAGDNITLVQNNSLWHKISIFHNPR